jgi:hypothetical protein
MSSVLSSKRGWILMGAAVAVTTVLVGASPQDQAAAPQNRATEEFTAFAINTNTSRGTGPGPARPTTAQLTIRIERWSTDEERDKLLAIVKEGSSNVNTMNQQLLRAMQALPRVGFIRGSQTLGWDLRFARQAPLDEGGRRIVIGTDRRMPFWEVRNRPRSFDYPFTIIQMQLDKNNEGEGKLLADTRIFIDPRSNDLVLEHFDIQPVSLNQIRRRN